MLRPATPQDADRVATVIIESRRAFLPYAPMAHPEASVRQWVRDELVAGGGVWVWQAGADVVGVLATSAADGVSWIDQLYVLPGCTGAGIGARLLLHAHGLLTPPIRLYTFAANQGARRFYERHGYQALAFTDGSDNEELCPDVLYERQACKAG